MKCNRWSQLTDMNESKYVAACTVYEGKIVVSGGWNNEELNSVEAYDYYENKWTYLPDMIEERDNHASVSIGNKLFVIGGCKMSSCEMFDSFSRRFCYIKTFADSTNDIYNFRAVSITNQLVIFGEVDFDKETKVFTYNVKTGLLKLIDFDYLKNKHAFSCIKFRQ